MSPARDSAPASASALPPLPDLNKVGGQQQDAQDPMAAVMSGVAPIKMGVDQIQQACKGIVGSGMIPGSEQICSQILALATSLLPMAVQQAMMPQGPAGMPGMGGQPGQGQQAPGPMPMNPVGV